MFSLGILSESARGSMKLLKPPETKYTVVLFWWRRVTKRLGGKGNSLIKVVIVRVPNGGDTLCQG